MDDTSNYTCYAINTGSFCQWNTTIKVMRIPLFDVKTDLPYSDEKSLLRFGWRFYPTNLTCTARGMPHPLW